MKITEIVAKNFKTFKDLSISINNFNIIIGSNASGKSNLIDIIKFYRDCENWGLDSAISLQGGKENLLNYNLEKGTPVYLYIKLENHSYPQRKLAGRKDEDFVFSLKSVEITTEILFNKTGNKYKILQDDIKYTYDLYKATIKGRSIKKLQEKLK